MVKVRSLLAGGLIPGLGGGEKFDEFAFGTKPKVKQTKTTNPMQDQFLQWIQDAIEKGEGPLAEIFGGFNEEQFNKGIREPELKKFEEEVLPMIRNKFVGSNQAGGSGQRNAELRAGTDLQSKLAQLLYQAQQGQKQNQIEGVNTALNKQTFENQYQPATTGFIPGILKGAGQTAANVALQSIAG